MNKGVSSVIAAVILASVIAVSGLAAVKLSTTGLLTAGKMKQQTLPMEVFANTNLKLWLENDTLKAKLILDNETPVSGETVYFSFDQSKYSATTDKSGVASVKIGNYSGAIVASYPGNGKKYLNGVEESISTEELDLSQILPPEAKNVVVKEKETRKVLKTFTRVKNVKLKIITPKTSLLTGFATKSESSKIIVKKQIRAVLNQPVKWKIDTGNYEIEYETSKPIAKEIMLGKRKKIIVESNASDHYYNISAFTTIPELSFQPRLYHIVNGQRIDVTNDPRYNVSYWDTNGNGLYDKITWIVPMLSNDTYEIDLTILNLQSYPTVGGNWTVKFTTQGTADLWIRPVNGTTWSLSSSDNTDLQFLDIRCGNESVNYQWINGSVYVLGWSCNETGYEISHVKTHGHHYLEFKFGNTTKYAENFASGQTICGVTFSNITYEFLNPYGNTILAVDDNGNVLIKSTNVHTSTAPSSAPVNGFGIQINGVWNWTFNASDAYISGNIQRSIILPTSAGANDVLIVNASNGVPLLYFNGSSGDLLAKGVVVYQGAQLNCPSDGYYCYATYYREHRNYYCNVSSGDCDYTYSNRIDCRKYCKDICHRYTGCSSGACSGSTACADNYHCKVGSGCISGDGCSGYKLCSCSGGSATCVCNKATCHAPCATHSDCPSGYCCDMGTCTCYKSDGSLCPGMNI